VTWDEPVVRPPHSIQEILMLQGYDGYAAQAWVDDDPFMRVLKPHLVAITGALQQITVTFTVYAERFVESLRAVGKLFEAAGLYRQPIPFRPYLAPVPNGAEYSRRQRARRRR
jgi:hypothetical protein